MTAETNHETVGDVLADMRKHAIKVDWSSPTEAKNLRWFVNRIERAHAAEAKRAPSYDALLLIAQSVARVVALSHAGTGEAIDVLRERWERKIAAEAGRVPEAMEVPDRGSGAWASEIGYARGWNACRDAMLSAAPDPKPASEGDLLRATRRLVIAARTSGGTAGRDDELCAALDAIEPLLPDHPSPEPPPAEPAAQPAPSDARASPQAAQAETGAAGSQGGG